MYVVNCYVLKPAELVGPCTDRDGQPITYATLAEAEAATLRFIREHGTDNMLFAPGDIE